MNVAVVLLNYNGRKWLELFLQKVIDRSAGASIYVIDNGSSDESLTYLNHFPHVKVVALDKNYGYAGGYNRGLKYVHEDIAVLLNTDIEPAEGWLNPLVDFLQQNSAYAACQPKILSYHHPNYFEYAGAAGGMLDLYGIPFCRGRIFSTVEEDRGQYDEVTDIFWASGAALCIRLADFFAAGGFDDNFIAHQEEIDLCWRLQRMGKKIAYVPQSVIYHVGGGTLAYDSPRKIYLNIRNNRLMLWKNLPSSYRKKVFRVRLFLDYMIFFQYLLQGKFSHAWQVLKALRDAFTERKKYSVVSGESLPEMIFKKSIVWWYFVKRKKFYSQLPQC